MGCTVACSHGVRILYPDRPLKGKKVFVDGPEYETIAGCGSNLGIFDPTPSSKSIFTAMPTGWTPSRWARASPFVMECFEWD
jgi:aldehyde:ferredoxin oxidoreductase